MTASRQGEGALVSREGSPPTWVVVLNYQGGEHLRACLRSLRAQRVPVGGVRCLVVDNASTDGSAEAARREFPEVDIVVCESNTGYAGGNNLGLRRAMAAGAEWIALLNMDVRVHPDWLVALVEAARRHPNAALLGARVLNGDGTLVEFDGGQFDPVTTSGGYALTPADVPGPPTRECAYACGAALLARARALHTVGLFDETFFAYHEDVELSLRCWRHGFSVVNVADSIVYHAGGGAGAGADFRDFMGARNSILALFKLCDRPTWAAHGPRLLRHFLTRSRPHAPGAILSASFVLPTALARRPTMDSGNGRSYRDVVRKLRRLQR